MVVWHRAITRKIACCQGAKSPSIVRTGEPNSYRELKVFVIEFCTEAIALCVVCVVVLLELVVG